MKKFKFGFKEKENKLGSGYLTPNYSSKTRILNSIKYSRGGKIYFGSYCRDYKERIDKSPKNKLF